MAWGISWIAVGRLTGEPASTITAVAAIVVAAVLVVAGVLGFVRARRAAPSA